MHGEGPEEQIQGNIMGEIMATYETDNNIPESLKKRGWALAEERRAKGFKSEMKQIGKQM